MTTSTHPDKQLWRLFDQERAAEDAFLAFSSVLFMSAATRQRYDAALQRLEAAQRETAQYIRTYMRPPP